MEVVKPGGTLLTVTERGYGKRTEIDEYRVQSRGGVGVINISTSERNGPVVGIAYVQEGDELLLITQQGMIIRMQTNDVRAIGRATQGVRLIDIEGEDKVVSIARLVEKEEEDKNGESGPRCPGRAGLVTVATPRGHRGTTSRHETNVSCVRVFVADFRGASGVLQRPGSMRCSTSSSRRPASATSRRFGACRTWSSSRESRERFSASRSKSVEEVSAGSKVVRVDAQVRRPDGQTAREIGCSSPSRGG